MYDEHGSFAKVYFLKRKSEALERIKDFFAWVAKQFKVKNAQGQWVPKYTIDKWVCNGGGEYISKELSTWMSGQHQQKPFSHKVL
jgi:hypothetical protein